AGEGSMSRRLLILTLLATVVAHFIEIHFGIAIAATRTYFWALSAVLVGVGVGWLPVEDRDDSQSKAVEVGSQRSSSSRKRRRSRQPQRRAAQTRQRSPQARAMATVAVYALLAALMLFTLAFDFVHNEQKLPGTQATAIFWNSLTSRVQGDSRILNLAILVLVVSTWLVGMLLALATAHRALGDRERQSARSWLPMAGLLYTAISLGTVIVFGLIQAGRLLPQLSTPDHIASHINVYYAGVFALLLLVGGAVWWNGPLPTLRWSSNGWASGLSAVVIAAVLGVFIVTVNVSLVKADVYYKMGQNFDSARQWNNGIALHSKALEVAGDEDFYRLFRGRAELELAKEEQDPARKEALLEASLADLMQARVLNPLNTDHSANLGRLYRGWGDLTSDPEERRAKWQKSLEYYEQAITLSPFSAHLYNEYGLVYQTLREYARAEELYQESLALDQEYTQTFQFLAELYRVQERWSEAAEAYTQVVELEPRSVQGYSGLGYVYAQQGKLAEAIEANHRVLELSSKDLASTRNLALLYQQSGDLESALEYARIAKELSPEAERPQIDALIRQIEGQMQ
ncbi:MAG TPA: tetratricopeptide repeat protein, partial [Anaerolineae bacterium]|nr:tetratricopeptide repeat protein [Anaerolineae bacterium]